MFGEIDDKNIKHKKLSKGFLKDWINAKTGGSLGKFESNKKVDKNDVLTTIASGTFKLHYKYPRFLSKNELCKGGTFPIDYNFKQIQPKY